MNKELTDEEISRLGQLSIFDKVKNGDWYQFGKEKQLQEIVKRSSQKISEINDKAKENFDEARKLL
ncbi:MAG: sugar O-acetyltransferase, partial [Lactococcus cremoris]